MNHTLLNKDNTMNLSVLISCMHQKDASIIERSNIQTDVVIVNQCNEDKIEDFTFTNKFGKECHAHMIYTTERGLSKSRNLAIANAKTDICLICDDDEIFVDNYEEIILNAYAENKNASVITFKFNVTTSTYVNKTFWTEGKEIGYLSALKISSQQISFRREAINQNNIRFDVEIGSGASKAGGEEKIFLHNCLEKGLNIRYVPQCIVNVSYGDSQWAHYIYSKDYFVDFGYYVRRLHGRKFFAVPLCAFFAVKKYSHYKNNFSFMTCLKLLYKGIFIKK